jgi:hypothetical protein
MTTTEFKLLLVSVFFLSGTAALFKQDVRKNLFACALGCVTGFFAQLPLGRDLNLYTPNISLYVSYVSLAVVVIWGITLGSVYAAHLWICRTLGLRSRPVVFLLTGLPVVVIVEAIGSNVIGMKLHDYTRFAPLLPFLNAMQAPPWLYGYYIPVSLVFYLVLRGLRIHTEDWSDSPLPFARSLGSCRPDLKPGHAVREQGVYRAERRVSGMPGVPANASTRLLRSTQDDCRPDPQ